VEKVAINNQQELALMVRQLHQMLTKLRTTLIEFIPHIGQRAVSQPAESQPVTPTKPRMPKPIPSLPSAPKFPKIATVPAAPKPIAASVHQPKLSSKNRPFSFPRLPQLPKLPVIKKV